MNRRLRRALAGLALTTAAATGTLTLHAYQPSGDTAWGAPATNTTPVTEPATDSGEEPTPDPLDTAWG